MTVREAAAAYGTKIYKTSVQESILTLVDTLYQSRDDVYFQVLTILNNRYDWDNLDSGSEIKYISKPCCSQIYEITY